MSSHTCCFYHLAVCLLKTHKRTGNTIYRINPGYKDVNIRSLYGILSLTSNPNQLGCYGFIYGNKEMVMSKTFKNKKNTFQILKHISKCYVFHCYWNILSNFALTKLTNVNAAVLKNPSGSQAILFD